jgi:hypothetical protein
MAIPYAESFDEARGTERVYHRSLPSRAAVDIALTMRSYPVHLQRLPDIPSRISGSLGNGFSRRRASAAMTMPGMQ